MKLAKVIPSLLAFYSKIASSEYLYSAIVYGSEHDDVFTLQCGLDGSMVLSIDDYPLGNDRVAKFTDFKVGDCTVGDGIEMVEDGENYDLSFDSEVCGTVEDISASAGVQMSAYYESADGETQFFQKTVSLNAACNLQSTYTAEYTFNDIQKVVERPDAIKIVINFTLMGFSCPVPDMIINQILAILYQALAQLDGILDLVSIDTGCPDQRKKRDTSDIMRNVVVGENAEDGIPFAVAVMVEVGTATEIEILALLQALLDAAETDLNDTGLHDWVIDEDTEILPNYVPESESLIQEFIFELTPMNQDFTAEEEPSDEAGQMVYFKLNQTGSDLGEFLTYTVRSCKVVGSDDSSAEEYVLYDESENEAGTDCGRSEVHAKLEQNRLEFNFEYLLFLFSGGNSNRSVYSLVCEVVLCRASDADSVCKRVEDVC